MMQLGLAMNGIEEKILDTVKGVAESFPRVTYVEIGVGEGATLTAVAHTLRMSGTAWRAIGIELPNGYSFSRSCTEQVARDRDLKLNFVTPNCSVVYPQWGEVTVYFKDSQSFLTEHWQEEINLALIDGCHGKPCVILDFLALEAFMVPNSVMMFHDITEEQIGHAQPHCQSGIDVRGACLELGLMTGKRGRWEYMGDFIADKNNGGWDMGVFKKNG